MKNTKGFTLIELVVVIVILGILAVTAAPLFLNLQGDARSAALDGVRGSIAGANGIVYGKAAIEGVENEEYDSLHVNGNEVETSYGHILASEPANLAYVVNTDLKSTLLAEIAKGDKATTTSTIYHFGKSELSGEQAKSSNCYLIVNNIPAIEHHETKDLILPTELNYVKEISGC